MFQLGSAVFQVLYSHMWLVASLINNTNTECRYGEENGNKVNISKRIGLTVHKGKAKKKKKCQVFSVREYSYEVTFSYPPFMIKYTGSH